MEATGSVDGWLMVLGGKKGRWPVVRDIGQRLGLETLSRGEEMPQAHQTSQVVFASESVAS